MAETLSPRTTAAKMYRTAMASRVQSPPSPFVLGSNDDKLERAQARAARAAAAIRRKNAVAPPPPPQLDHCLGKEQILDLFQNCIKLSSENKINQKNTWELGLIDHLCEIVKVEEEADLETNFQKASCTLEAGVKIYSMRVDSVHSEAYKVLGGINRAGQEDEQDTITKDVNVENGLEESHSKKDQERKISSLSTLESSFEALNVKKFDVAFAVDPLYHQTTAQFDEGGAKGLLLNNLGIYGECRVLFDSMEVPGKCMPSETQNDTIDTIDLSSIKEYVERMVSGMRMKDDISPTIMKIIDQFDEDKRIMMETVSLSQRSSEQVNSVDDNGSKKNGDAFQNSETWNIDQADQSSMIDEDSCNTDPFLPTFGEENGEFDLQNIDTDERTNQIDGYLLLGLGLTSNQNAWAGPEHWKFRKAESIDSTGENGLMSTAKIARKKKQAEVDLDFIKKLDKKMSDVFAPPKNPQSLLLSANREVSNTKLPEDCHYQPENLVKLFLLPNVLCLGKRRRKPLDEPCEEFGDGGPSWDAQSDFGGQYDDGIEHSDVEDSSTLVSQPRQVSKIEVEYNKTSKQVDVQALKETLWDCIQESTTDGGVSFKSILGGLPSNCRAAAAISDISPHLCFICLLHLANEHGLSVLGCVNLDDLTIHLSQHTTPPHVM